MRSSLPTPVEQTAKPEAFEATAPVSEAHPVSTAESEAPSLPNQGTVPWMPPARQLMWLIRQIEMIEEMARLGLTCECLILTSYPDFEFARKAVKFGAFDYLLKPVDPDELIDNIAQAEQAVGSRKRHLIEQEQITLNRQLMTNTMFARLLIGYDHDEAKVRRELEQAGLRIGELAVVTAAQPD